MQGLVPVFAGLVGVAAIPFLSERTTVSDAASLDTQAPPYLEYAGLARTDEE
jgi:hypothetical protein